MLLEHDRHRESVAQGLAHLLALRGDPRRVHPAVRRAVAGGARLRHLVFVVREAQVEAAAVDVEHAVEVAVAHRRAFDVPAGAAGAERRLPARVGRVGGLRALPQREVARVALVFRKVGRIDRIVLVFAGGVHRWPHAVGHGRRLIDLGGLLLVRELAVVRPRRHIEVHVARELAVLVAHHVGMAVVDDALDQVDHVHDVPGGARFIRRRQYAQLLVGARELLLVVVGARPPALPGRRGFVEDLVVDVGHIADERDAVAEPEEPTADDVERHTGADVPDVRRALHSGAAHVHAHLARLDRLEPRDLMRRRVVELQVDGRIRDAAIAGLKRLGELRIRESVGIACFVGMLGHGSSVRRQLDECGRYWPICSERSSHSASRPSDSAASACNCPLSSLRPA